MRAKLTPGQAQPPRPSRRCRRRRRDPELRAYVPTCLPERRWAQCAVPGMGV